MTVQDIKRQVRAYVQDHFVMAEEEELSDDTSFLARGILDSTSVLELVGFLEERFGIQVEDQEMVPENLDSLAAIADYVTRKQRAAA